MPGSRPFFAPSNSAPAAISPPQLITETGIDLVNGRTVATTAEPWLRVEPVAAVARHRWIRLRYAASYFDEAVRPLIRFRTKTGPTITLPMNGTLFGSAEWIGRVPDHTIAVSISPVRRPGPFAFRIDEITSLSRLGLLRKGLRRHDWLYWAVRSRLVNSRREAWHSLCFAACGTPTEAYGEWRARFARPLELNGLDQPHTEWQRGPRFHLMLDLSAGQPEGVDQTIQSLRDQIYSQWRLYPVNTSGATDVSHAYLRMSASGDARLMESAPNFLGGLSTEGNSTDFVALIEPGDVLPTYALAVVGQEALAEPHLDVIYGDEDRITADGRFCCPVLKPDWSPVFEARQKHLGRGVFLRARGLTGDRPSDVLSNYDEAVATFARTTPRERIQHIRRILYSRAIEGDQFRRGPAEPYRRTDDPAVWPRVVVVIPTRDQAKLLEDCITGLRARTDYPELEIVIVDNGSTQPDAVRLLKTLADQPRTAILRRPGPFNYSALSNDGARASDAPVLLFLNNDVVPLDPGWLKPMVRWAIKPEIGAVGAKLLFPHGLIQHAGVVVGFGGIAGHLYIRLHGEHRGYLDAAMVPREVSAVTAACVVVERSKFATVGGFDADNLPVDLNDIDFCLRLGERGWTNLCTPEATLVHRQSATRGVERDPYELYRKEREYFVRRWAHVIRDDPYFHPALSLYAHDVALA
jgi:O-antigen biosynthesis protein